MTTMTSTAINASGAVGAILAQYRQVLTEYQKQVTGDPAAVSKAAATLNTQATAVRTALHSITDGATRLDQSWHGSASDAYRHATQTLAGTLEQRAAALQKQSGVLTGHATALTQAQTQMTTLLSNYDAAGARLQAEASCISPAQYPQALQAAHQLGNQGVTQGRRIWSTLYVELGGAAGPKPDPGVVLYDHSWRRDGSGTMQLKDGSILEGSYWAQAGPKITGDGTIAQVKGGRQYTGKIEANLLDVGAQGRHTDGINTDEASIRLKAGGDASGTVGPNGVSGKAEVAAELKGDVTRTERDGDWTFETKDEGAFTADAKVEYSSTDHHFHAKGEADGEFTETKSVEYGGVKLGVSGGVVGGEAAAFDPTYSYDNGHLKLDVTGKLADGVGAKGGVHLDVDVPKVTGELRQGWQNVENTAERAGQWLSNSVGW